MALVASPPVKPCPICKSQRFVAAASGADWAARADDDRRQVLAVAREHGWTPDFHINRCDDCGFLALSPMPDAAWLGRFYGGYYASPAYDAKRHRKIRRSRRRLARLAPFVQGGDFLDVGCNLGFACAAASDAGYQATGIDLDAEAIARATDDFPACRFETADLPDFAARHPAAFDLVHCAAVIEHLTDVRPFAEALGRVLRPGGILFVTTPDAGHFRRPRDLLDWPEVKPPEHLCWFTRTSLARLMDDHGLSVERFFFSLKPGLRLVARKR